MESRISKISMVLSTASCTEAWHNLLKAHFAQVSFKPVILLKTNLFPAWSTRSVTK